MKRFTKRITGLLLLFFFFSMLPTSRIEAATGGILIDGTKDAVWSEQVPLGTSENPGWEGFDITNLYMTSDEENLYFYVDAKNVPNWGDNGQYINIALNVDGIDSTVSINPWGGQYDFSGTDVKPNFHIAVRVKGDTEVNGAALYASSDLENPILASWADLKGAEFALNRETGFEGKIPLAELGLTNGSKVKAIAVLSGNTPAEHGAFDVIPQIEGNTIATSWNESGNKNILSTYSSEYTVELAEPSASKVVIDGVMDALWAKLKPVAKSPDAGFNEFNIGDLVLTSDKDNLYFWVDALKVDNWGDEGLFINIALNMDGLDSGISDNPWAAQFDFSGTDEKPNYHINMRVRADNEISYAAVYATDDMGNAVLDSNNLKGAEFALDRETGFEGKIPLSLLGLTAGSEVKAITVLSGNNSGEHGAFDVIPQIEGNSIAASWNESSNKNVQSVYSAPYIIGSPDVFESALNRLEGPDAVLLGQTASYTGMLSGEENEVIPASEINWSVTAIDGSATTVASISEEGILTALTLPQGALARKVQVKAERKSNAEQIVKKTVMILKEESPGINEDGTVTFLAEYAGDTLNLVGSMNGWSNIGIAMVKNADGIFEVTIPLTPGTYEYKFFPVSGSWDGGFADPVNKLEKDGNSVIAVPGIKITTAGEVKRGEDTTLSARFVNLDGTESDIIADWSLKNVTAGVSIEGNVLTVTDAAEDQGKVTVVASHDGYVSEKELTIVAEMYTYNIHYYRYDGKASDWALWVWEDGKDGEKIDFASTTESGFVKTTHKTTASRINVIPRTKDSWAAQEATKVIEVQTGNTVDVWLIQDVDQVFYNESDADVSPRVRSAMMDAMDKIYVNTTAVITDEEAASFKLKNSLGEEIEITSIKLSDLRVELTIVNPEVIDVREHYTVESAGFTASPVTMRKVLDDSTFYYDGKDLGLTYTTAASTFKLWAPTATKVSLVIYSTMGVYNAQGIVTDQTGGQETLMSRAENGLWSSSVEGDHAGKYYMYKVEFADGKVNYAVDPYAVSVSPNGQRTAIVNLENTNPEGFKTTAKPQHISDTDAVLYEVHVRDFSLDESSGVSEENKGKFSAFTEEGTTLVGNADIKTGIDHLKELGITHVHLLPSYDYKTINEMSDEPQFNWGYDPQNYNVPEGSYSTDVLDPAVRIKEFKGLVQSLHENGIRVVMDVVYNHTFESLTSSFDLVVPGYYYRTDDNGIYLNGSGTGNEVASERPMVRKYIKDSVLYWADEYGVDGFRFDLMGLIDLTTMTQITNELKEKVDPSIMVYGEPWDAGTNGLPAAEQTKKGTQKDKGFAVFNDNFRNAIKGDSDGEGKGFASGAAGQESGIVTGVQGAINDFTNGPNETINYVTAHDNLNLWDKFIYTQGLKDEVGFVNMLNGALVDGGSVEEAVSAADPYKYIDRSDVLADETVRRTLLANSIVMTSQGIPFIQAGDEFLRTKFGDHNSYKSPDVINSIRWDNKEEFKPVFDYYKGLIAMRKSHPAFRMSTKAAVESNLVVHKQADNIIVYELKNFANGDTWKNIVVIYNGNTTEKEVTLPADTIWNVAVDETAAGNTSLREVDGNTVTVAGLSMMVLYDEEAESYEAIPTTIELSKSSFGIEVGSSVFVNAIVRDQEGRLLPDEKISWSSSDTSIAEVEQNGRITAVSGGNAVITAIAGDVEATVDVHVGALVPTTVSITGENILHTTRTMTLSALVRDQFGQTILSPEVKWTSSNPSVATVTSQGLVTGVTEGNVTITAKAGEITAEHKITVMPYVRRFVYFNYIRPENDYTDWNIWVWNTGVKNDQIDFTEITEDGAFAKIEIAPDTKSIGFVLRKGTDWAVKDAYGEDRFITTDLDQTIIKVTVTEGVKEFHATPAVRAPEINQGAVTFNYRDEELFAAGEMDTIKGVQLKINEEVYDMDYVAIDELFTYTLNLTEEGTYEYSYIVTYADGTTKEISDPKNTVDGISVIVYIIPKIDVTAEAYPSVIDYSENAVITIKADAENPVNLREVYLDLRAIGGKEKVSVDLQLMAHTISVKDSVTAGEKVIPVTLVDEFGNEHLSEVTLTVKPRQILSENDFDWDEAMIYFMLTDRFNNGDETNDNPNGEDYNEEHLETYHGGDLKGITEKLDYLDNLGINTLWITPVVDNIDFNVAATWGGDLPEDEKNQYAYHGYWAKDFEKLDEHLGSLEDFKELIDEAHERGIKIMLDVVVNHAGYGMRSEETNVNNLTNFPTAEEQAKFDGMFREPGQTDNIRGDLAGLPDFKTEDPLVRDTLVKWQTAWLERARTDKGNTIDYFRIDTVNNVEPTTLKALKNALTEIDPKFKSIGEAYGASINNDGGHLGTGQLDSVLDFSFKYSAVNFVNGEIDGVETYLQEINSQINNTQTLGLFLGSHDEDGFLTRLEGTEVEKLAKLKAAAALQITAKGQPVIYYGEELGASGKAATNMDKVDGNFGENRYDMPWERLENMDYKAVHDHYQKLLTIRADYSKVFAKGTRTTLGGGDAEKYIVFNRSYNGKDLVVAINTDVEAKEVTVSVPFDAGTKVMDLYGDVEYTVGEDQKVSFSLPATQDGATVILAEVTEGEEPEEPEEEITPLKNVTSDVIEAILNSPKNATIIVDARDNKIVDASVFEALKKTNITLVFETENATWTFKGNQIKEVKDVDLTITVAKLKDAETKNKEAISKLVKNSDVLIISIAGNGVLPGKATVKVKLIESWLKTKDEKNIFIYYYDETSKKAELVEKKLEVDAEGYVEFSIKETGDYIVSGTDLVKTGILPKAGTSSENALMLLFGTFAVLGGVSIFLLDRKRKNIIRS